MGTQNGVIITISSGQGDDTAPKDGTVKDDSNNREYSFTGQTFQNNAPGKVKGTAQAPNNTAVTFDITDGAATSVTNRG